MESFELTASRRTETGKGANRRLRRAGKVPGIVYGFGKEPVAFTMDHEALLHHLENEAFYSHILVLNIGNSKEKVVLKDLQRHPWRPVVLHLDLLRIDEAKSIVMHVPLHFLNEDRCTGVKNSGGMISHTMTNVEVRCLPKDLPEYIEVDMLEIDIGQTIHLGELSLPEGVENYTLLHGGDPMLPVVSVHMPRTGGTEAEEEAEQQEQEMTGTGEGEVAPDN